MTTRVLALSVMVLGVAACAAEPADVGTPTTSAVVAVDLPTQALVPVADVLLVVDRAAAAPEAGDALAAALVDPRWRYPSLHVGVTTTDPAHPGALRSPPGTQAPFLVDVPSADGTRTRNYPGELATALAGMLDVAPGGARGNAPELAARLALAAHPDFARSGAAGVVIVVLTDGDAPVTTVQAAMEQRRRSTLGCACVPAVSECDLAVTLEGRDATYAEPLPLCPAVGPCVAFQPGCCAAAGDELEPSVVGLGLDYTPTLTGQCIAAD